MKPRVELDISTLAVYGLPGLDVRAVAPAAERELARLLQARAIARPAASAMHLPVIHSNPVVLGGARTSEQVGVVLARQLYRSVWR